jgi:hypothetical protein
MWISREKRYMRSNHHIIANRQVGVDDAVSANADVIA